eukprot:scaffold5158_cov153-Amphora_coffeaeformis.AAC.3
MVYQDGFRVSLYNPATEQFHKEFYKEDGTTFVEAAPDAGYFIDVELLDLSLIPRGVHLGTHIFVDGKDLGWIHWFSSSRTYLREGIRQNDGKRALAFALPKLGYVPERDGSNGEQSAESFQSQVMVCIHECIERTRGVYEMLCPTCKRIASMEEDGDDSDAAVDEHRPKKVKLFNPTTKKVKINVPATESTFCLVKKKEMRSVVGKTIIPKVTPPAHVAIPKVATHAPVTNIKSGISKKITLKTVRRSAPVLVQKAYVLGKHITTITIKYCSTVGLIVAGVLPKPHPDWKPSGLYATAFSENDIAVNRVNLEKITETITYTDNNGLKHQAFQLDLTELSDDGNSSLDSTKSSDDGSNNLGKNTEAITYTDGNGLKHEALQLD